MDKETILTLFTILGPISGLVFAWLNRSRAVQKDTAASAAQDATLAADMAYIKRGIDDMRVEIRQQGQRYDALAERVTRLEGNVKQAHLLVNRLKGAAQ